MEENQLKVMKNNEVMKYDKESDRKVLRGKYKKKKIRQKQE